MKIAYISSAFLADCDLPLLRELTHLESAPEVHYFLQMSDSSRQATVINVSQMKPEGRVVSASEFPELSHLSQWLPLERVHVVNFPQAKDLSWQSWKAVYDLYRILRREGFDVVHLTSPLRYGSFLLYLLRRRMVLTMHDPMPHSSDMSRLNRFHRWMAFHCVRHFVVLSHSLRDDFVRFYHLEKKQVHLSRLGTYSHLQHTEGEAMELPRRYVLFAGSINPHKGIRYLCEAMSQVLDQDLHLVIAGRGKFDFDIQPYLQSGRVHLINRFVTNEELKTLIERSLFVCCPYKDATQSGVIMSAFALNKPVLATRVGALHEMLTDGRHGRLVPPCDARGLACAIEEMLVEGTLAQMSQNIEQDYAVGERSWHHIAEEKLRIYQTIEPV